MKDKPNTLRLHQDGTVSYRIDGRWFRELPQVKREHFFLLPTDARRSLWQAGARRHLELVEPDPIPLWLMHLHEEKEEPTREKSRQRIALAKRSLTRRAKTTQ